MSARPETCVSHQSVRSLARREGVHAAWEGSAGNGARAAFDGDEGDDAAAAVGTAVGSWARWREGMRFRGALGRSLWGCGCEAWDARRVDGAVMLREEAWAGRLAESTLLGVEAQQPWRGVS